MSFWELLPALAVLAIGAGLYAWTCVRFPPALLLGVVAYSMISKSASVAYIETVNVYLIEVGMYSQDIDATLRHSFYNMLIAAIALLTILAATRARRSAFANGAMRIAAPDYSQELRLALRIAAALLAIQIVNAVLSPPYALPGQGISRYQFWDNVRFPLVADLVGVLVIFVPAIAGVAVGYGQVTARSDFRRYGILLITGYIAYFMLTGARFGGFLMAFIFLISSYGVVLWAARETLPVKRVSAISLVVLSLFLFVGYLDIADRSITTMTGSAFSALLYRAFALQGGVYFAADVLTGLGGRQAIDLILQDMTTTRETFMAPGLAEAYAQKGVNLAGSLPGNAILTFGYWVGILPMALYAVLLGLILSLYVDIIASGRFLLVLPGAYLCLWINNCYTQGSFAPMLDYKVWFMAAVVGVVYAVPREPATHTAQTIKPHIGRL